MIAYRVVIMTIAGIKVSSDTILARCSVSTVDRETICSITNKWWMTQPTVIAGLVKAFASEWVTMIVVIFASSGVSIAVIDLARVPSADTTIILSWVDWHTIFGHTGGSSKGQSSGCSESVTLSSCWLSDWELVNLELFSIGPYNTLGIITTSSSSTAWWSWILSEAMGVCWGASTPCNQILIIAINGFELGGHECRFKVGGRAS